MVRTSPEFDTPRWRVLSCLVLCLVASVAYGAETAGEAAATGLAKEILETTGVQGGLVLHLGCGDGRLTAALHAGQQYLVHGLDAEAANVEKAREYIRSRGLYGKVSVDGWTGSSKRLPYVDNLANLIVLEDSTGVPMDELIRVLAPLGVACVKKDGAGTKTLCVKPWPKEIDQWTHYLHDADGNAVAHDSVVGPPRHFQWVGSPRWSRHHDRMASLSALVSAGGRIFYIFDEGPTASIQLPPRRFLIARDAFNGTVLWKKPIPSWHTHLWPYKSGHAQLPRRLVAVGQRVYVTLGHEAPLTALDAATGQLVRTYRQSRSTEEVIASDGVLFLLVNDAPIKHQEYLIDHRCMHEERNFIADRWPWDQQKRRILAVEADSGKILWNQSHRVVPITLAADAKSVFFHDGQRIVRLDRHSGRQVWGSSPVSRKATIPTNFGPTLVVHRDVVLFSGGDRSMTALSARTGKTLWTEKHPPSGHHCPEDLLVAGGLVWSGAIAGGKDSGVFTGRDLHTGEIKGQFPPDVQTYWFHQRCYRSKATDRFLLPSRTGIEFVDFRSKHWATNHWVRGGCIYGIMPCNGLVYAPPHSCACYIDAKLNGFCALAPESPTRPSLAEVSDEDALQRGPAFGRETVHHSSFITHHSEDWPT